MADDSNDQEFPIPFQRFVATLKGTPDEIWGRLLALRYGRENHLRSEWLSLLADLKQEQV